MKAASGLGMLNRWPVPSSVTGVVSIATLNDPPDETVNEISPLAPSSLSAASGVGSVGRAGTEGGSEKQGLLLEKFAVAVVYFDSLGSNDAVTELRSTPRPRITMQPIGTSGEYHELWCQIKFEVCLRLRFDGLEASCVSEACVSRALWSPRFEELRLLSAEGTGLTPSGGMPPA